MLYWAETSTADDETKSLPWYYRKPRSTDIEQTSYVLLAKLTWEREKGIIIIHFQ